MGYPVAIDGWGVDVAYSGTQKCLGVSPGLAPFTLGARAWERRIPTPELVSRPGHDRRLHPGGRPQVPPHRPHRHDHVAPRRPRRPAGRGPGGGRGRATPSAGLALQDGLEKLGLELWAAEGYRLPQLTTVWSPTASTTPRCGGPCCERYGIEIGGGVGPWAGKVWRIGCMGHTARLRNVTLLLAALSEILGR